MLLYELESYSEELVSKFNYRPPMKGALIELELSLLQIAIVSQEFKMNENLEVLTTSYLNGIFICRKYMIQSGVLTSRITRKLQRMSTKSIDTVCVGEMMEV